MDMLLAVILLALGTSSVLGAHFRGGTMSWTPTGNGNEVKVTYNMGFYGFRLAGEVPPKGHDRCSETSKYLDRTLGTTGYLDCSGCVGFSYKDMEWKCADFSIESGWDIGGDSTIVQVNEYNNKAVVSFNQCCWLGPLVNGNPYNEHQGYKMITEIDLNPRPDNGLINNSPVTALIPVQLFHSQCQYWLEIPVTDPDNDPYRCRYTNTPIYEHEDECYDVQGNRDKSADICRYLPYVTVYDNCTLLFDTSGGPGWYAVRVMIEDLDASGDPLSRVSLSFLLEVAPDSSTCRRPIIVAPKSVCKTIPANVLFYDTIIAEAATEELFIKRIETTKPHGMTVSGIRNVTGEPFQKAVDIAWRPTTEQIGKHQLGFNAVDRDGFSSGWTFLTLNVNEGTRIYPVPEESNPSPGQAMMSTNAWTVRFNRPIQRPTHTAFITLVDSSTGFVVDRLDASDEQSVSFSEQEVTFSVSLGTTDRWGKQNYTLAIDGGVAIDATNGECSLYSSPLAWDLVIIGAEKPVTKAPPVATRTADPELIWKPISRAPPTPPAVKITVAPPSPLFKCKGSSMEIPPPLGTEEGEECFIHLTDSTYTVSQNSITVPYKICCPSSCDNGPPSPPVGPPGCV